MRKDLTHITMVIDCSGSMQSCKSDAEGGVNAFIEQQRQQEGECRLTLVEFDDTYKFVHRNVPIKDVPRYALEPRGYTALYDAIGRAIHETGDALSAMKEEERPGLVVFVILTDGNENASREFNQQMIRELIEHQQNGYAWQFTFLGANQDAFKAGGGIGIARGGIANYSPEKSGATFQMASASVCRMRSAAKSGEAVLNAYSDAERSQMI